VHFTILIVGKVSPFAERLEGANMVQVLPPQKRQVKNFFFQSVFLVEILPFSPFYLAPSRREGFGSISFLTLILSVLQRSSSALWFAKPL